MLPILIFSLVLIAISVALVLWHLSDWKNAKTDSTLGAMEREFYKRQCRRRVQASGMIGLIGIGLAVFRLFDWNPLAATFYTLGLAAIACWIMLLALGDVLATRLHMQRMLGETKKGEESRD